MIDTDPQFTFRIEGNHEDVEYGNAIPKVKLTGRQQWTRGAQRYKQWKYYVQAALMHTFFRSDKAALRKHMERNIVDWAHPIVLGKNQYARMDIAIGWAKENHADPESVFGSIADALFENDKHLSGSFSFVHSADKGYVDVQIWIEVEQPKASAP